MVFDLEASIVPVTAHAHMIACRAEPCYATVAARLCLVRPNLRLVFYSFYFIMSQLFIFLIVFYWADRFLCYGMWEAVPEQTKPFRHGCELGSEYLHVFGICCGVWIQNLLQNLDLTWGFVAFLYRG